MSTSQDPGAEPGHAPSEEELRAAYEAQLSKLRVEHIVLDNVVMLINLGMRRTGMAPGTEAERDPAQVRLAIESVRALLPQVEAIAPAEAGQIRDALSQLQLAYVRIGGQAPGEGTPEPAASEASSAPTPPAPEPAPGAEQSGPGPAQRSGRLWVPGQ
jgi:hypothetical protein